MSEFNFVPLSELTQPEIAEHAGQIHEIVNDPIEKAILRGRHLLGVIERHEVSPAWSGLKMTEAAYAMRNGELSAYVVTGEDSPVAVGMATIQPGLDLYRQRLPLPARFTRNSALGIPMVTPEANVAAWVKRGDEDKSGLMLMDQYTELYGFLNEAEPSSWTVEPSGDSELVHLGIMLGGYKQLGNRARYDDLEDGTKPAPRSALYVSNK